MSARAKCSETLLEAADHLDPLDLRSPFPEKCLQPALDKAKQAWKNSKNCIDPVLHGKLRVSLLSVRLLNTAVAEERPMRRDDITLVRKIAHSFREIAAEILVDRRTTKNIVPAEKEVEPHSDFSPRGLRFHSLQDMADAKPFVVLSSNHMHKASTEDDVLRLKQADAMKSHLPHSLPVGKSFVVVKSMPLIVYPRTRINEVKLNRSGAKWFYLKDTSGKLVPHVNDDGTDDGMYIDAIRARGTGGGSALLLEDQFLIGFRHEDVEKDPSLITQITKLVSRKKGPHTNPLAGSNGDNPLQNLIKSSGNPLIFLWLVPNRLIDDGALSAKKVSFPWLTPQTFDAKESDADSARRELKELQDQQAVLIRRKMELDPKKLTRMSELLELVERFSHTKKPETFEEKTQRLANAKKEIETRVQEKFAKQIAEISEMKDLLTELVKSLDEIKQRNAQINDIKKQLLRIPAQKALRSPQMEELMKSLQDKLVKFTPLTNSQKRAADSAKQYRARITELENEIDEGRNVIAKQIAARPFG